MRQRQLEAFRAVMLCQTVTKAAAMLRISQPAVTRLVADLEESVGFKLFERGGSRLKPTAEANLLYEEVKRALVGVEQIARTAYAIKTQQRGTIHIATAPSLGLAFIPRFLPYFLNAHRDVRINLGVYDSRTIVEMVIEQRCDAGIVNLDVRSTGTSADALFSVALMCAVPLGHRLAARREIGPLDLQDEVLIAHPSLLETRLLVDTMLAEHRVRYILGPMESLVSATNLSAVSAGLGITFTDPMTAMDYRGNDLKFIKFKPQIPLHCSVLLPLHRDPPKLATAFIERFRAFALSELDQHLC